MAQVFAISHENKMIDDLLKSLEESKSSIKDLVCIVRSSNGDMNIINSGATFETLCSGSKMLDYMIDQVLDEDNTTYEITEEENE